MSLGKVLLRMLIFALICVGAILIHKALSRYSVEELFASLEAISLTRLLMALGFAAASYLCLTGFDYFGIRYAGKRLAYRRAALASFTSLSIGHNIGVAALSSGAVRYRFYSRWGLTAEDVAKIIIFSGMTVGLGLAMLCGIGLMLYPDAAGRLTKFGDTAILGIALPCLIAPLIYILSTFFIRGEVHVMRWSLRLPEPGLAIVQVILGTVNFAFVAACLYQLLSAVAAVQYLEVAAVYAIANGTALLSHIPGGLGVLEATVLLLLPGTASLAALIAFRIVYFFIPLPFGLALFLACEYLLRNSEGRLASPAE